jgi:tRNA A-37 threonylcarbamoyl transferase component Bud32/tetratricopeptide (TPR) repeat protein
MDASNTPGSDSKPESRDRRVDAVCDAFEVAWKSGPPPAIADYLTRVDEGDRSFLLGELLGLELELRCSRGDSPDPNEYLARFPDHTDLVYRAFDELPESAVVGERHAASLQKTEKAPPERPSNGSPTVPGYDRLEEISRGGMGIVYRARQVKLNRIVALKMMLSGEFAEAEGRARFRTESEVIARLAHPNIVQVYEVGEHEGRAYFSMEYVAGESLADLCRGQTIPVASAAALVRTLALAVHEAHQRNVVHRDLKPANVLLAAPSGTPLELCVPKITDFGLAKRLDVESLRTQTGAILGTPAYMAPEQAEGRVEAVGPATDIYSLGVILYEVTTGGRPFKGDSSLVLHKVIHDEPPSPRSVNMRIPRDLETIILKCLEKDASRRYPSALALAEDLGRFLDGESVLARRQHVASRILRKATRRPGVSALLVLAAVGVLVIVLSVRSVRRVAALTGRFDQQLLHLDGTEERLREIEAVVDELGRLDSGLADAKRKMLTDLLARRIDESIRTRATIGAAEAAILQAELARLEPRNAALAAELKRKLGERLRSWQIVGDLPTGSEIGSVFDPTAVSADRGQLVPKTHGPATDSAQSLLVPTKLACVGNVRLDATFAAGTWGTAERVGLFLYDNQWHTGLIRGLAIDEKGEDLLVVDDNDLTRAWSLTQHSAREQRPTPPGSVSLAFGRVGGPIDEIAKTQSLALSDVSLGAGIAVGRSFRRRGWGVAVSPAGKAVAIAAPGGPLRIWSRDGDQLVRASESPAGVPTIESMALADDGRTVALGDREGHIVLTAASGTEPRSFQAHDGPVTSLAFDAGGAWLASGGADATVRLWRVADGSAGPILRGHTGRVTVLAFAPDGHAVASGGTDRQARLWPIESPRPEVFSMSHNDAIGGLAFTPNSKRLAVGYGRWITFWDLQERRAKETLRPEYYAFRIAATRSSRGLSPADGAARPRTLGDSLTDGKPVLAQVLRNGEILREQLLRLPDGPLQLSASLEGDRLALKVARASDDTELSIVFRDLFPLWRADRGVFGLEWPASARLERLTAWRQAPPARPSLLESGDENYSQNLLSEALDAYRGQQTSASDRLAAQEARCKEGLCLLRLDQVDDATRVFEELSAQPGDRWPAIATCQLWLLKLRQGQRDEADAIYTRLESEHPRSAVAGYVPPDVPTRILKSYAPQSGYSYVVRDPRLVPDLERAVDMARYLQAPADQQAAIKFYLACALHATEQLDRAEAIFQELLASPELAPALQIEMIEQYVWVLSRRKKDELALAELERRLATGRAEYVPLLLGRARLRALRGDWVAAKVDLEQLFRQATEDRVWFYDASLLRGFVREALGDPTGARESWRAAYLEARGTSDIATLTVAIQASLSDALSRDDARLMFDTVVGQFPANVSVMQIVRDTLFGFDDIAPALRSAWNTPEGLKAARRIALHDLSFSDFHSIQVLVTVAEVCRWGAYGEAIAPDDAQLNAEMCALIYRRFLDHTLTLNHMTQLMMTWRGLTVTWRTVAPVLDEPTRGHVAYLLGSRYVKKKWSPSQARAFFEVARDCSPADSNLHRQAKLALDRLGKGS